MIQNMLHAYAKIFLLAILFVVFSYQVGCKKSGRDERIEKAHKQINSGNESERSKGIIEIAKLLKDTNPNVRIWAASELGELGAKEYTKDIIVLLNDKDSFVSRSAKQVLEKWGVDTKTAK